MKRILVVWLLIAGWPATAQQLKLVLPMGHTDGVSEAHFTADGKKIITSSSDGTVKVWDAANGLLLYDSTTTQERKNAGQPYPTEVFSPGNKKKASLSDDGILRIWDVATGAKLAEVDAKNYSHMEFSPDSKKLAISSYYIRGFTRVLDAGNGSLLLELKGKAYRLSSASFSNDGSQLLLASWDNTAQIWNTRFANVTAYFNAFSGPVMFAAFSADNQQVIMSAAEGDVQVWQVSPAKHLVTLKDYPYILSDAVFSPDKKQIIITTVNNFQRTIGLWDAVTGKLIKDLTGQVYEYERIIFDSAGKLMANSRYPSLQKVYRLSKKGALTQYLNENSDVIRTGVFSPDDKQILLVSRHVAPNVQLWNVEPGAFIKKINLGPGDYFEDVNFNTGLVMVSRKGMLVLFDLKTGEEVYQFVPMADGARLSRIASGYYQCSREAAKLLHYVTSNMDVITFDQLDVRFNRPDKVMEANRYADPALIKAYRNAYYKRIQKLGIDTGSFSGSYTVPITRISNREAITYEQTNGKLTLRISNADSISPLQRFHVWVNETPVYGLKGIDISGRNALTFDTSITLPLSAGENRIEICVSNASAVESYRSLLMVKYTPPAPPKQKLYFVGIGIDKFANASKNLKYCSKDIRDLAKKFEERYGSALQVDTLFNSDVTLEKVRAIKQRLAGAEEEDKIIIAYSGHGLLSSNYDYYLSAYNINFDDPAKNGIPFEELENLVDGSRSRKKLMLLDACHSGEVDQEEMKQYTGTGKEPAQNQKGIKVPASALGLKGSFELMQELFVNTRRTTGTTIIAAAGGKQYAAEHDEFRNGVLTHSILELLKGTAAITVNQLKKYVCDEVVKLTNGVQQPVARYETLYTDWQLW